MFDYTLYICVLLFIIFVNCLYFFMFKQLDTEGFYWIMCIGEDADMEKVARTIFRYSILETIKTQCVVADNIARATGPTFVPSQSPPLSDTQSITTTTTSTVVSTIADETTGVKEADVTHSDRPMLMADGEIQQLKAFMDINYISGCDFFKSGGACSPTQQALDYGKSFMIIHQYFNSDTFRRFLLQPDSNVLGNEISRNAFIIFKESGMSAASCRTFLRFLNELPTVISGAFTMRNVQSAFSGTGIHPFSQREIFLKCPAYAQFTIGEQSVIDAKMHELVARALSKGYSADEEIYSVLGHIIGYPARGLSNTDNTCTTSATTTTTTTTSNNFSRSTKSVISLQTMLVHRWRAAFFTEDHIRLIHVEKENRRITAIALKTATAAEKEAKKVTSQLAAAARVEQKQAKANEKKIPRPQPKSFVVPIHFVVNCTRKKI